MKYKVRDATKTDVPDLVLVGAALHAESAYSHTDYDYEIGARTLLDALEFPDDWFLQVITEDDKVVGFLLARLEQTYFGHDSIAYDLMLGLKKESRGKCFLSIQEIVDNYHQWARGKGAKRIFLMTTTNVEAEQTAKLYETLGFKQIGTIHEA